MTTYAPVVPEQWMESASCAQIGDPDLWFPEKGHGDHTQAARLICHHCPVSVQCLDYSRRIGATHGMWAGLTAEERAGRRRPPRRRGGAA